MRFVVSTLPLRRTRASSGPNRKADVNTLLSAAKTFILLTGSAILLGTTPVAGANAATPAATPITPPAPPPAARPAPPPTVTAAATPAAAPAATPAATPAPSAPRKETRTASVAPPPGGAVAVNKGDTLQKIIARSLGHLPFKPEILRAAMMQKNPAAFKSGKPESLAAGSVLQLPTMEDFRRLIPAVAAACAEGEGTDGARADAAADPRKGWVRFP